MKNRVFPQNFQVFTGFSLKFLKEMQPIVAKILTKVGGVL